ncbi:DUF3488 and transglutaminase-like domain-containing protein [Planctomycetes bacterium Poly30]|uniref:transglutaminase family protein n=1 Tax=Saltatorellus ferox TaxID=2528018 RepID=UPI0011A1DD3E
MATVTSLVILATVGAEAARGQPPESARILSKFMKSAFFLAVALFVTSRTLRRETERATRGRAVLAGAWTPAWIAAGVVALQCLLLTLVLMAGLEVVARTVVSDPEPGKKASRVEAIEKAIERRREALPESDDAETERWPRRTGGLVGPGSGRADATESETGESGVRAPVGDLLSDEPVLRVTTSGPADGPGHYLRGLVLDEYGANGTLRERRSARAVLADAGADGWIQLNPGSSGTKGATMPPAEPPTELTVEFLHASNGLVFAPSHLRAIRTESIQFAPGAEIWSLTGNDKHRYGVRSESTAWPLRVLEKKRSAGSLPGDAFTELPPFEEGSDRDHALRALRAYSESLTFGNTSDLEDVLDVLGQLRNAFGYELYDTSLLSPERCLTLLERGAGSCSHFASLAAILLRLQGIPTRIAIGYLASEPLPDENGFLVRSNDGHAWIEVHFEDLGWLTFDGTPEDSTSAGADFRWAPVTDSDKDLAIWTGEQGGRAGARTSTLGDWVAGSAGRAVEELRLAFGQLARSRTGRAADGVLIVVLALGALLAVVRWLRRRLGKDEAAAAPRAPTSDASGEPALGIGPPPLPEARALLAALEARGLRQARTETPSAFARGVEQRHGEAKGLLRAFRALLGHASTHRPLTSGQKTDLKELTQRLRTGADSMERSGSEKRP